MDSTISAKNEIIELLSEIYGGSVGGFFHSTHVNEAIPIFVHNSYVLLKQNLGEYKATEQLDQILSRHGVSIATYE